MVYLSGGDRSAAPRREPGFKLYDPTYSWTRHDIIY